MFNIKEPGGSNYVHFKPEEGVSLTENKLHKEGPKNETDPNKITRKEYERLSKEIVSVGLNSLYPEHMKIEEDISEDKNSVILELFSDKDRKLRKAYQNLRNTLASRGTILLKDS